MITADRDVAAFLGRIRSTTPVDGHDGRSGAQIARAVLDDGSTIVVKRVRRADDLAMLASDDRTGREAGLWSSGVLDHLPPAVTHPILAAGWDSGELVTCMRDLGGHVLTRDRKLTAGDLHRVFAAVAQVHAAFAADPPPGLCPLLTRLPLLSPQRIGPLSGGRHQLPGVVLRGWEHFADLVPADVVAEVFAAHADPSRITRGLSSAPPTLLHGDLTLVNMALRPRQLVLLDWTLATAGPAVLDFVCFLANCVTEVDLPLPALMTEVRSACGPWHEERALRAALFWGLAEMGWNKALDAVEHPDPAKRAVDRAELAWWTAQARTALDTHAVG